MDQAKSRGLWMLVLVATAAGCGASVSAIDAAVVPADASLQDGGSTDAESFDDAGDDAGGVSSEAGACPVPANVPDGGTPYVVELAVGDQLSQCARMSDGTVRCRGRNLLGQLGLGRGDRADHEPTTVPCLAGVEQVVNGIFGSICTRHRDGTVRCWGINELGLAGVGHDGDERCEGFRCRPSPVLVPGLSDVVFLAGGRRTNCAVRRDGSVWCWGNTALASSEDSPTPRAVPAYRDVVALWPRGDDFVVRFRDGHYEADVLGGAHEVPSDATLDGAAATDHLCYLLADGTVRCLGVNAHGKVGNGASAWPERVTEAVDPGLRGVRSVVTGAYHSCAILADHTVSCWGSNELGGLGFATTQTCAGISPEADCATRPGPVPVVDGVAQLFLGVWGSCALRLDHSVWCWGGLSPTRSMVPAPVAW